MRPRTREASIKAAEQLANVRARLGWEIVDKAARDLEDRKKGEKAAGQTAKARAAARRARIDAERSLRKAITRADRLISQSLDLLTRLIALDRRWSERASSARPTSAERSWTASPGGERESSRISGRCEPPIRMHRSWANRAAPRMSTTRSPIA